MKKYALLSYHMKRDPRYLFGNAEVAGLLAGKTFSNYTQYKYACDCRNIPHLGEEVFNQFMIDCDRTIIND